MADLVTSPVLFNPSEDNGHMISRVDINANNAISSSPTDNSSSSSSSLKRARDGTLLDNNGNIVVDPSEISPPLAKRLCYMQQRSPREEKGKLLIISYCYFCNLAICLF